MPPPCHNAYSPLLPRKGGSNFHISETATNDAGIILQHLNIDSATGPDELPARILKECSDALATPLRLLFIKIITSCKWPKLWRLHWIIPLHKKKDSADARNYRGIHVTSHLSKCIERLLKLRIAPCVESPHRIGPNQFAYCRQRGARDALAYLTLRWIDALARKCKVGVYCSDVSGAFDRVRVTRLIQKLTALGFPPELVQLIESWLQSRTAHVLVAGEKSHATALSDMLFQGTVLGPILWNLFYGDARDAIRNLDFEEIIFVDDLNEFKIFAPETMDSVIDRQLSKCQCELHTWGSANQVSFDAEKESMHILSILNARCPEFTLLGITFDGSLIMETTMRELIDKCKWKLIWLLRVRKYHSQQEMVLLYRAHVLSFIEHRTAAIYHSHTSLLDELDALQTRFGEDIGLTPLTALSTYHLAPLDARRDIAMLGLIHRATLDIGPPHLREFFKRSAESNLLENPYALPPYATGPWRRCLPMITNSAFGLIPIYNALPSEIKRCSKVKTFQRQLQNLLLSVAKEGHDKWNRLLSPRVEHKEMKHLLVRLPLSATPCDHFS